MKFLEFQAASKLLCYHMLLTTREPARSCVHASTKCQQMKMSQALNIISVAFVAFKFSELFKTYKCMIYTKAFIFVYCCNFRGLNNFQRPFSNSSCSLKLKFSLHRQGIKAKMGRFLCHCLCDAYVPTRNFMA
jgi:hypothetical protein